MSKAFTRESDDLPDAPMPLWSRPASPATKNYLTPAGARRLQEELTRLADIEHPMAEALSDAAERKRQLQALRQRMAYLHQNLQTAKVVPPPTAPWNTVKFGATVTVRDRIGRETSYRIVGIDEADADRDWVSWQSPLARALLNARLGQRVRFQSPDGEAELEIVAIAYE
jgi:transcription elongation factor GreB